MASGTITFPKTSSSGRYIEGKIEWTSVANNSANTSNVTVKLYVRKGHHSMALTEATDGSWNYSLMVNGSNATGTAKISVLEAWVLVHERTVTNISHNSDGTKSISISGSVSAPSSSVFSGHTSSGSGTAKFDTVPRASSLDSIACATNYFTGMMTYKYKPQSPSFYNRCVVALNLNGTNVTVKTINIGQKAASQQTGTVTLTESELSTIYNKLPETDKGIIRFTLSTYSDSGYSTQVGNAVSKELTLYIPETDATRPTVNVEFAPSSLLKAPFDTLYIMGRTKVAATFTNGKGKYGASIKSYSLVVNGNSYGSPYISGYLSKAVPTIISGVVTDSRGFTSEYTTEITVLSYSEPKLLPASDESEVVAMRCDQDGNPTDSGTYLKIKALRSYSPVIANGEQHNSCKIQFQYKRESDESYSDWKTILSGDSSGDEIVTGALLEGALSVESTYMVKVQAIDDMGEYAEAIISVPTDKVHTHRTKNGMGLGKYCEGENLLDVGWDAAFHGNVHIGSMTLEEYILSVIKQGG